MFITECFFTSEFWDQISREEVFVSKLQDPESLLTFIIDLTL
jgi:hypothetical protein